MSFETRHYLAEDDMEDSSYMPLKLHSLSEFLDTRAISTDGHSTEQQHVSSNASEESEGESLGFDIRRSLHLAQLNGATDRPRECFCLDNVHCICGKFFLPPLVTRNTATALQPLTHGLTTSSSQTDAVAAPQNSSTATTTAFGETVYISLCAKPVKLTAPMPVMSLGTLSTAFTGATTAAAAAECRC
ncbi:hypothetical protein JKF63_06053 [Porcisia hertigi]|uniref:Uncharacterized protein n=1 Tax=Porcisia hertigi TaxID=2761500 RepID=A0A836LGZ2_9TRYP|nr:hypothetical protein JKF63_06053 [Porcisia hertigi]